MSAASKPTFEEVLAEMDRHLEDEAEAERVRALSPDQIDDELRGAGADPAEVQAMAERILAAHALPTPDVSGPHRAVAALEPPHAVQAVDASPPSEKRPSNVRWLSFAGGGLALAAAAVLLIVALPDRNLTTPHVARSYAPRPEPTPDERRAEGLREEARALCDAHGWQQCEAKLIEADKLDPAGANTQPVRELREVAARKNDEVIREMLQREQMKGPH